MDNLIRAIEKWKSEFGADPHAIYMNQENGSQILNSRMQVVRPGEKLREFMGIPVHYMPDNEQLPKDQFLVI